MTTKAAIALTALFLLPHLAGCGDQPTAEEVLGSTIEFEPDRPSRPDKRSVEAYEGSNQLVLDAQKRLRTGLDLHRKVIHRTCTPNGGVCHNRKEYPDMHTPANFFSAINAPCNVQPGQWESVYDGCERPGDRFQFDDRDFKEIEIGWLEYIAGDEVDYGDDNPPEADSIGLHIHLNKAVPIERRKLWSTGKFIRTFVDDDGQVRDLVFASLRTRWWVLDDGKQLMAEVKKYKVDQVNALMSVGIIQGDANRNGTYGARESAPTSLLEPGRPEESYLIGRLRGSIKGHPVPGSRMPLANQPLSSSEMLALYCFVEGIDPEANTPPDGRSPIDYKHCSYSAHPESLDLLGEGVSWSGRISHILEANCGGCHGGTDPTAGLNLINGSAYDTLLGASSQMPEMHLIQPNKPDQSYLWLKLNGDEAIQGSQMPLDPLEGTRTLTDSELDDINTWITNGATDE